MDKLQEILKGCIRNNRQSQSDLYKMFASKMYGVCLRYAGNSFDAQDILQDGFVKIFDSLKSYRGEGSLEGWMKRIFINMALDKYRSRISVLSVDEISEEQDLTPREASAIDTMSEKEILSIIKELPDQYRMVFNLFVVEGYPHEEIAQMLNIGISTSRSNLARAKMILKEKISFQSKWIEKAI
ncbi:MAG: RNA polymerase sigma factor [Bacteroidota bacterium]